MASNQKVFGFVEGDRVIYRPEQDAPDTSVGKINKVISGDKPRYVIVDEKTNEEKEYNLDRILQTDNRR